MTARYLPVALTQRVSTVRGELRLALDVRWSQLLAACGLIGIPLPLDFASAAHTIELTGCAGVILTGGDDLADLGGPTPDRDKLERELIRYAIAKNLPLLGVCRGMQILLHTFGVRLTPVTGHAGTRHPISSGQHVREVNSYHRWGVRNVAEGFVATAYADGVVEAVRHDRLPLTGIMWHPEREEPFDNKDIDMLTTILRQRP
ncbi:gamma-glutamyl-gamma-aminobutyrate hydrolase family protein [Amycolatopsis pithecellobii]|uniref:Gamma-glutamyl-gamma-aminobutyrate hydrolase n=1 Tax=Amycolatopsis pithecellobii TaxID=664692 RepID=A0A6N7YQK4_9PSEU|nr:gamma-glutamyl-gamma-aminobutyrate hydrolase family protein [Amycolatopsis pithecellobii]MTD54272.1 gamma-glutamyl-gamma-aminobutyrate hydrolase [Amycolatopsis pithecellobii]